MRGEDYDYVPEKRKKKYKKVYKKDFRRRSGNVIILSGHAQAGKDEKEKRE